jgi:hypothetical protein
MAASALIVWMVVAADPQFLRLAEEAEAFARALPNLIGEETLRQRAVPERRMPRIRVGEAANRPANLPMTEREVRSEIAYATFSNGGDSPASIHELRKVIAVDGRPIGKPAEARRALVLDARSADDDVKRKLLAELERHLISVASLDFSLTLLLFNARALDDYEFQPVVRQAIGEDMCQMWAFRQKAGEAGFTRFAGKQVNRQPLSGMLWLREKDGVPLRVRLRAEQDGLVDDAVTDYRVSTYGLVTPARVTHRRISGNVLVAENVFEYAEFKRFSTESGISFTPVDEEPPKP